MTVVPVGNYHTVRSQGRVLCEFSCKPCGYSSHALVKSRGTGHGNNFLWLDAAGASQRAKARAQASVVKNAQTSLAFVPCPSCNRRNVAGMTAFAGASVFKLSAMIACLGLVGLIVGARDSSDFALNWFLLVGFAAALYQYVREIYPVHSHAADRVEFLDHGGRAQQV